MRTKMALTIQIRQATASHLLLSSLIDRSNARAIYRRAPSGLVAFLVGDIHACVNNKTSCRHTRASAIEFITASSFPVTRLISKLRYLWWPLARFLFLVSRSEGLEKLVEEGACDGAYSIPARFPELRDERISREAVTRARINSSPISFSFSPSLRSLRSNYIPSRSIVRNRCETKSKSRFVSVTLHTKHS